MQETFFIKRLIRKRIILMQCKIIALTPNLLVAVE